MKEGWATVPIGEVCQTKPPKAEARKLLSAADLVSFVPMEDLGIGEKILAPSKTRLLGDVSGSYTYFANGDVLLAKITPCFENGKLSIAGNLANGVGFGSSEYIVLRPSEVVTKEWLYYFLLRPKFREEGRARMIGAVGHKRIPKEFVESYPLPLPAVAEQHRIVSLLDEAFVDIEVAKENTEKNIANARTLFASRVNAILVERGQNWVEKSLKEVATDFGRGRSRHRPRNDRKLYGGSYPFIQTGDVRKAERYIEKYEQTYNDAGLAQSKLWPAGTVCITIAANIAETAILGFDACFPDSVIGVVVDDSQADNRFLQYLLESFKAHLQAQGKGSAQDNINMGTFERQKFPFPPVSVQKEIAGTLDALREDTRELDSIYRRKESALDELKQALLHNAFAGNL